MDYKYVHCGLCNKKIETYFPTFYVDKEGKTRYGAICPECHPKKEETWK